MKKQLIVMAGLTAMFAACTNEDVIENFEAKEALKSEGITFSIASVESRGDFKMDEATSKFVASWNAEVDKINVAHFGAVKAGGTYVNGWNNEAAANTTTASTTTTTSAAPASYKATKTANKGEFTAASDTELLTFTTMVNAQGQTVARPASFRAYRGKGIDGTYQFKTDANKVASYLLNVTVPNAQTQAKVAKAPFDNFVMVSDPINDIHSYDLAVGESLPLSFERPFAGLVISTTGYNKNLYGKLQTITVTAEKSALAGNVNLDIYKKVNGMWSYSEPTSTSSTVTLTIEQAADWSDNYYAFMQILPVDRSTYRVSEIYTVALGFENGTITVEKTSSKNWTANNFYTVNVDLNETADYLLSGNTLTVIKGMPKLNAAKQIDGTTLASEITKFTSYVALTADELKQLNDEYTGITELSLANEASTLGSNMAKIAGKKSKLATLTLTQSEEAPSVNNQWVALTTINGNVVKTIPANAFAGNTTVTKYNFPKVETIGATAFKGNTQIKVINCYDGELVIGSTNTTTWAKTSYLTTIGDNAFDGAVNINKIDAPALTTFGSTPFGTSSASLTNLQYVLLPAYDWAGDAMTNLQLLINNSALVEVDLSGTTNVSGVTSLVGKANLKKVILAPNSEIGASAFYRAGTTGFEIVNINKIKSVGESAFAESALTQDIKFVNTVKAIGKNAFAGTAIPSFDFTGVETIGESAFQNATALNIVTVPSVETIEANTFAGCTGIVALQLNAATVIKKGALDLGNHTANIVLKKAVTFSGNPFGYTVPSGTNYTTKATAYEVDCSDYTLYVNSAQEGVDVSAKTLTWQSGNYWYKATFGRIVK